LSINDRAASSAPVSDSFRLPPARAPPRDGDEDVVLVVVDLLDPVLVRLVVA
jgi:hypothetical protein|tara:strand:+ start:337 stop:492 length:156 start_codon:yes stop_codon:yes gene_type:complete